MNRSILSTLGIGLYTLILASCDMAPQGSCDPTLPGCVAPNGDTDGNGGQQPPADDNFCTEASASATAACVASGGTIVMFYCDGAEQEYLYACDLNGDGSGDVNIENNNTNENNNSNTGGDDDDDDSGADDDDDTGEPDDDGGADILGSYGCVHLYDSAIQSWLTANGTPDAVVLDDYDSDGDIDQVWMEDVLDWTELGILDLDDDGNVDDADWECSSWPDGTSDTVDNDGDGETEAEGDFDDRTTGNAVDGVDVCGDAVDNDYDGSIDEECENDSDGDGEDELEGDCNDAASTIYPAAYEYNNGVDDDCDGSVDEPSSLDGDGDGYCESGIDSNSDGDCNDSSESSSTTYDCNDAAASIYPGATDYGGDGNDNDCDGTDE